MGGAVRATGICVVATDAPDVGLVKACEGGGARRVGAGALFRVGP